MEFEIKKDGNYQFVEEGNGPVVLLLHGLFGALSNFQDVLNYFSRNYKVVIPLMPIYRMPLLKANVDGLSAFVHKFIEHRGYRNINVMGNSLGGHISLIYTLDHQECVRSLTLTGSSGLYENAMGGSYPKRNDYNFIKERVEYTFFDPANATKELVDEVYETINDRGRAVRIISTAKSAIRHNLRKEIEKIKVPTCLIWGKNDSITPPEVAEEFDRLIPNTELHIIDKCGHAPMMERPEEFNRLFENFLNKLNVPNSV